MKAVAQHFKVPLRTAYSVCTKQRWSERLADMEARSLEVACVELEQTMVQVNKRHLKSARDLADKSIEFLESLDPQTFTEAIRGLEAAVKQERLAMGAASQITESIKHVLESNHDNQPIFLPNEPGAKHITFTVINDDGEEEQVDAR